MSSGTDHFSEYHSDFTDDAAPPGMTFAEVDEARQTQLTITPIKDFAAVDEATAEPMMGDEETCLLSHGGTLKIYGDGGAGKTTLEVDFLCHLAAGDDWLGLNVPKQVKILVIENEGPRGMFRKKLRRKLATWAGSDIGDRIHVLEDPWALFTFDKDIFREQLQLALVQHDFDMVAAGPVQSLGIKGGGTPEEVAAFMFTVSLVRSRIERPCAMVFVGHENKAGDVAGAWEGVPDTLMHLSNQGHGSTRLFWQKVRWGPELHGKTWQLAWDDGETFSLVEAEVRSDSEIEADMLLYAHSNPGCTWKQILSNVEGNTKRMSVLRDALFNAHKLENRGRGGKMEIWALDFRVSGVSAVEKSQMPDSGNTSPVNPEQVAFPRFRTSKETLLAGNGNEGNAEDEDLDFGERSNTDGDIPF